MIQIVPLHFGQLSEDGGGQLFVHRRIGLAVGRIGCGHFAQAEQRRHPLIGILFIQRAVFPFRQWLMLNRSDGSPANETIRMIQVRPGCV